MARLFFALWPDAGTRAALASAAASIDIRDARPVRPENLHLTLHFLGEVDAARAARLRSSVTLVGVPPFDLHIADAGWWRESRSAWLAPLETPAALVALVDTLASHLAASGLPVADRPYRPHVTVARQVRRAPRVSGSISVHWRVPDFALVASRTEAAGARYEVLQTWPLGSADA